MRQGVHRRNGQLCQHCGMSGCGARGNDGGENCRLAHHRHSLLLLPLGATARPFTTLTLPDKLEEGFGLQRRQSGKRLSVERARECGTMARADGLRSRSRRQTVCSAPATN
eukprot:2710388-Prymnesium_polylepis.1